MMRPLPTAAVLALAALATLAGCDPIARPVAMGAVDKLACTACHGDATRDEPTTLDKVAPPATPGGKGDAGAHLAHLHGGAFRGRIACGECHQVHDRIDHTDGRVELTFGPIAAANGVAASYDPSTGTCTVWCHGPRLSGGPAASPVWSGRTLAECGDCHGAPPPNHDPGSTSCNTCHPGTVDAERHILVANGLHMNGVIDADASHPAGWDLPANHGPAAKEDLASCQACHGTDLAGGTTGVSCNACHAASGHPDWQTDCTFCHGNPASAAPYKAAPPVGTRGQTLTTDRAVGAHQRHLAGGGVGPAAACGECHPPVASLAHVNGAVQIAFGAAASAGGRTPQWSTGNLTCSNTACHLGAAPVWTGGASQAICGTCHGVPPAGHSGGSCGTCHTGYTAATVNPALHMNGAVDASGGHPAGWSAKEQHGYQADQQGLANCKTCHGADLTGGGTGISCSACHGAGWETNCTFCHGNPATGRSSPPVDVVGRSARTFTSVGAHDRHADATLSAAVACATCHAARGNVITDAAHVNGGPAEVAFSGLGTGTNTYVRVDDATATCTVYCHGAFPGGKTGSVSWTSTAAMTCTSCHASPSSSPHVQRNDCGTCHTGYSSTAANRAVHVNGVVDTVPMTCTSCHGDSTRSATAAAPLNAAPPADTTGAASGARVGAHQRHLAGGTYANGFSCQTCHSGVGTYTTAHADGTRQVGFTGAASANLRLGSFTAGAAGAAGTCSNTFCHGAKITRAGGAIGGTLTSPTWTATVSACTACHSVTTTSLSGRHTISEHRARACSVCHGAGYTATTTSSSSTGTGVNKATHVDGTRTIVTVPSGQTGVYTWVESTRTCTASCHGSKSW